MTLLAAVRDVKTSIKAVSARKVDASAADRAAIAKAADSVFFSAGGGLIQTTSG